LRAHAVALEDAVKRDVGPRQREPAYFAFARVVSGLVAIADGRVAHAEPLFRAAIETLAAIPIVEGVAAAVDGLAACATASGDQVRASALADLAAGLLDGSQSIDSVAEAVS
jgi:hypothetical protein